MGLFLNLSTGDIIWLRVCSLYSGTMTLNAVYYEE